MKFFDKESRELDWDNIEFVYVEFEPRTQIIDKYGEWNPNFLGIFRWGARGVGFGEIAVYKMSEGKTWMDSEHMGKRFIKQMMNFFVEQSLLADETDEVPEYHCRYKV
jgi:hypothetical protein